jgi:signal transduction histidine kinase
MKIILLVDDDEQIRFTFGMALRARGYRVLECDNGPAGLEMAKKTLPDLILTDINMPGGGGRDLLHHIRQDPELCARQVVLMTGRPEEVTPRMGMAEGADDFLVKPIRLEALLSCVEARLSRAEIHWRVEDRHLASLRSSTVSTLPHELFTPLAGIIGLSEILEMDDETLPREEAREYYRGIHQSALRLQRTLRNYLFMLFPDQGDPDQTLSALQVEQSFREGLQNAAKRHDRTDDLRVDLAACPLRMGATSLSMVVEELVDNACKFSGRGTPITVRLSTDGVLEVGDQGRGMTAEEMEQFGVFQQFDRKKREQQGLGLGVSLVRKLAGHYGATLSTESTPGEGTRVKVKMRLG